MTEGLIAEIDAKLMGEADERIAQSRRAVKRIKVQIKKNQQLLDLLERERRERASARAHGWPDQNIG
jgi:hypothetical protein